MALKHKTPQNDYLFKAILSLETEEDCYNFFEDLCTFREIEEMSNRLCGAKMLSDEVVYTAITEKTGISTATISRINRCLKYGNGGYAKVIDKLNSMGIQGPYSTEKDNKDE